MKRPSLKKKRRTLGKIKTNDKEIEFMVSESDDDDELQLNAASEDDNHSQLLEEDSVQISV